MAGLTSNSALIAILVSIGSVLISFFGLYLQARRDSSESLSKRIEESAKITSVSSELVQPLREELSQVRKDQSVTRALVSSQVEQIDRLQSNYDEQHAELRATKADRDNLLMQRSLWQQKIEVVLSERDELRDRITGLETKVGELEVELKLLEAEKSQGDFDPRKFMSEQ